MPRSTRHLLRAVVALVLIVSGASSARASVDGPDVSSHQHPYGYSIGWGSAHASGQAAFGFVKATEGTGYTNPYFASDFAGMAAAGMVRGAYHFASPASSAVAQAQYFVSVTGTLHGAGVLPPVLDLETTGGLSPTALVAWTQSYLQTIKALTGRTAIIYTGPYFWQTAMANSTAFAGYPLWIASYGVSTPQVPGGWSSYTFWQYTSSATLPGITGSVDMSTFNGTLAQLQALANGTPPAAPPFGAFDFVSWDGHSLVAKGWAIDPATAAPIVVAVSLDGKTVQSATAAASRPDVAAFYPTAGPAHGYAVPLLAAPGTHAVCVTALGVGTLTTALGCRTVTVAAAPPFGNLDSATWTGTSLTVAGWATDPATAASPTVTVSIDGTSVRTVTANGGRPDVAAVYPLFGADHGFTASVPTAPGSHQVCATARTVAGSLTQQLGCRTVIVPLSPPFGAVDTATWTGRALALTGWAMDPATSASVSVQVSLDGRAVTSVPATTVRPDLAAVYPAFGPDHGYVAALAAPPGSHQVCVTATNAASTTQRQLGCRTVIVSPSPPFGTLETATWTGTALTASGWAIDPATGSPITVSVSVDGASTGTGTASASRPDVGAVYPASGPDHGYVLGVPAAPGAHQVCVSAVNAAATLSGQLGCRFVTVPAVPPLGTVDSAVWTGSALAVAGWAISPATASPISVTVSVDGSAVGSASAAASRPDVAAVYPVSGPNHGYSVAVPAAPGPHTVCVTAFGTGSRQIGCRAVVVPPSRPTGTFDALTWTGSALSATGWALDPDTSAPISVAVSLDGATPVVSTAGLARPDVARAFPAYGADHGFGVTAPATPGVHRVCVTALNTGAGTLDTVLGCRTLTVPSSAPIGHVDNAAWTGSVLSVSGWTIDPDTSASISVTVTLDGGAPLVALAAAPRPDVAAVFPTSGAAHGFVVTRPAARGTHQVCVTALNTGAGTTNTPLGCRTVVVP